MQREGVDTAIIRVYENTVKEYLHYSDLRAGLEGGPIFKNMDL